jgi:hypothetical protein
LPKPVLPKSEVLPVIVKLPSNRSAGPSAALSASRSAVGAARQPPTKLRPKQSYIPFNSIVLGRLCGAAETDCVAGHVGFEL